MKDAIQAWGVEVCVLFDALSGTGWFGAAGFGKAGSGSGEVYPDGSTGFCSVAGGDGDDYKYDISYMIDDIINMLSLLRKNSTGEWKIAWLPDTFRSDWVLKWEDTMGYLSYDLNKNSNIILIKKDFISE